MDYEEEDSITTEEIIKDETLEDGEVNQSVEEVLDDEEEEEDDGQQQQQQLMLRNEDEEDEEEEEVDPSQLLEINHDDGESSAAAAATAGASSWHQPQGQPQPSHESLLQKALLKRPLNEQHQQHCSLPKMSRLPDPAHLLANFDHLSNLPSPISFGINFHDPEREERRRTNMEYNTRPRDDCPICGDRANGIHYGIYTCEGCKNFFKRSVGMAKPYACKRNGPRNVEGQCNVGLFEDDGKTRRRTRCQFCRYEACLDQGMVHPGPGARTPSTPSQKDPLAIRPVKLPIPASSPSKGGAMTPIIRNPLLKDRSQLQSKGASNEREERIGDLQRNQLKEEVQYLRSRVREMEAAVKEKDAQLEIQLRQIQNLTTQNELLKKSNTNLIQNVNGHGNGTVKKSRGANS